MTHLTADTSRESFRHLDDTDQRELVMSHFRSISPESSCIADVAAALHMERSTVSARMNTLKNEGVLEYHETRPSKRTGVRAMHFRIKVQEALFN